MDLLTFAAIIGTVSGLGALLVAFYEQWAHKERRKGLLAIGVVLLITGVLFSVAALRDRNPTPSDTHATKTDTASGMTPPASDGTRTADGDPHPQPEGRGTPQAPPLPAPAERPYSSWLRAEGLTILYDARRWITGGCTDGTVALGDFSPGGWGSGPEVQCRPDGWLAFDTRPLLDNPRFYLDHTYCLNFRNSLGNWGQHGGAQRAPGMNAIGVPAAGGPQEGINIGFRITGTASGHELQFTKQGIDHCQG